MAEFVQLRKEKWTEPLEYLRKLKLFKGEEFSEIIYKLENYEYKIQTPNRKLEDVLAYIEFECKLLKTLQQRRRVAEQYDRTDEIDRFIYNEIYGQFGSAEITFQHRIDYWNARLRFISTVVPNDNREVEFNRVFRKALNYCGRGHLELYRYCEEFCWSLFSTFSQQKAPKKKAKLMRERKNITGIMSSIREITQEARRNFPGSPEAAIWMMTTELRYLSKLQYEEELGQDAIKEEMDKAEAFIHLLSDDFMGTHKDPKVYFQFYEAVKEFGVSQADQLLKKIFQKILSVQPRNLEVYAWLIGKALGEEKIDECLERVRQTLSSPLPKLRALQMCLEKLDGYLHEIKKVDGHEDCVTKLIEFYIELLDKDNPEWSQVSSAAYHASRIKFLKKLPRLASSITSSSSLPKESKEKLIENINAFCKKNRLKRLVIDSAKQFPTDIFLVKERLFQTLTVKGDSVKPAVVRKILKNLNLRKLKQDPETKDQVCQLLYTVYHAFIASDKLKKDVDKLLRVAGTEDIRIIQARTMYLESLEAGRTFYNNFKDVTNDWRLATTVVEIEANACRSGNISKEFRQAVEDATRLAHTDSTEPWKTCIVSLHRLKQETQASHLMQRALKLFGKDDKSLKYEDLVTFSRSYKM